MLDKYSPVTRFPLQRLVDPSGAFSSKEVSVPLNSAAMDGYRKLINASVANSTWGKYSSAFSAFSCFEAAQCDSFAWPLSIEVCRAFVVWGFYERKW